MPKLGLLDFDNLTSVALRTPVLSQDTTGLALCAERADPLNRIEEEMHSLHLRYLRSRRS